MARVSNRCSDCRKPVERRRTRCRACYFSYQRRHPRGITHGRTYSPEWNSWQAMRARCQRPSHTWFHRYGGRGIQICDRWKSFEAFLSDMGPRPPGSTLERINNDGNYEPGNCRWATRKEQGQNMRTTKKLMLGGKVISMTELAARSGVGLTTLSYRLRAGWTVEDAAQLAPRERNRWSK